MAGVAAIVAFTVALILQLAAISKNVLLNPAAFTIIGLLCLAIHVTVAGGWPPWRRT